MLSPNQLRSQYSLSPNTRYTSLAAISSPTSLPSPPRSLNSRGKLAPLASTSSTSPRTSSTNNNTINTFNSIYNNNNNNNNNSNTLLSSQQSQPQPHTISEYPRVPSPKTVKTSGLGGSSSSSTCDSGPTTYMHEKGQKNAKMNLDGLLVDTSLSLSGSALATSTSANTQIPASLLRIDGKLGCSNKESTRSQSAMGVENGTLTPRSSAFSRSPAAAYAGSQTSLLAKGKIHLQSTVGESGGYGSPRLMSKTSNATSSAGENKEERGTSHNLLTANNPPNLIGGRGGGPRNLSLVSTASSSAAAAPPFSSFHQHERLGTVSTAKSNPREVSLRPLKNMMSSMTNISASVANTVTQGGQAIEKEQAPVGLNAPTRIYTYHENETPLPSAKVGSTEDRRPYTHGLFRTAWASFASTSKKNVLSNTVYDSPPNPSLQRTQPDHPTGNDASPTSHPPKLETDQIPTVVDTNASNATASNAPKVSDGQPQSDAVGVVSDGFRDWSREELVAEILKLRKLLLLSRTAPMGYGPKRGKLVSFHSGATEGLENGGQNARSFSSHRTRTHLFNNVGVSDRSYSNIPISRSATVGVHQNHNRADFSNVAKIETLKSFFGVPTTSQGMGSSSVIPPTAVGTISGRQVRAIESETGSSSTNRGVSIDLVPMSNTNHLDRVSSQGTSTELSAWAGDGLLKGNQHDKSSSRITLALSPASGGTSNNLWEKIERRVRSEVLRVAAEIDHHQYEQNTNTSTQQNKSQHHGRPLGAGSPSPDKERGSQSPLGTSVGLAATHAFSFTITNHTAHENLQDTAAQQRPHNDVTPSKQTYSQRKHDTRAGNGASDNSTSNDANGNNRDDNNIFLPQPSGSPHIFGNSILGSAANFVVSNEGTPNALRPSTTTIAIDPTLSPGSGNNNVGNPSFQIEVPTNEMVSNYFPPSHFSPSNQDRHTPIPILAESALAMPTYVSEPSTATESENSSPLVTNLIAKKRVVSPIQDTLQSDGQTRNAVLAPLGELGPLPSQHNLFNMSSLSSNNATQNGNHFGNARQQDDKRELGEVSARDKANPSSIFASDTFKSSATLLQPEITKVFSDDRPETAQMPSQKGNSNQHVHAVSFVGIEINNPPPSAVGTIQTKKKVNPSISTAESFTNVKPSVGIRATPAQNETSYLSTRGDSHNIWGNVSTARSSFSLGDSNNLPHVPFASRYSVMASANGTKGEGWSPHDGGEHTSNNQYVYTTGLKPLAYQQHYSFASFRSTREVATANFHGDDFGSGSDSDDDDVGFMTLNEYLLVEEIGKGQYGVVYSAVKEGSDKKYVIKIIDKRKIRRRFLANNSESNLSMVEDKSDENKQSDQAETLQRHASSQKSTARSLEVLLEGENAQCTTSLEDIDDDNAKNDVTRPENSRLEERSKEMSTPLKNTTFFGNGSIEEADISPKRQRSPSIAADGQRNSHSLTKTTTTSFDKEIQLMKRLRHRNIVRLEEVIDDPSDNNLYLVMPYIERGPVVRIDPTHNRCTPLDLGVIRRYIQQLLSAVAYLHHNNVAHCDIKPDNILLGANDLLYLTDFGVSEFFTSEVESHLNIESKPLAEKKGSIAPSHNFALKSTQCTPAFASPESLTGQTFNAAKADMWAVGVCMYLMIFGRLPFGSKLQGLVNPTQRGNGKGQTANMQLQDLFKEISEGDVLYQAILPSSQLQKAVKHAALASSKLRRPRGAIIKDDEEEAGKPRNTSRFAAAIRRQTNHMSGRDVESPRSGSELDEIDSDDEQFDESQTDEPDGDEEATDDHSPDAESVCALQAAVWLLDLPCVPALEVDSPHAHGVLTLGELEALGFNSKHGVVKKYMSALKLLQRLLSRDPQERTSAKRALSHSFIGQSNFTRLRFGRRIEVTQALSEICKSESDHVAAEISAFSVRDKEREKQMLQRLYKSAIDQLVE